MRDGVVLSKKAAGALLQKMRETARRTKNETPHRGRWQNTGGTGGSGAQIIAFQIVSSDPVTFSATVQIRQRTFTGEVYGSTLDDTVVEVYDTDGCYLNEPNLDLTDRKGHAALFFVDDEAEALHFAYGGAVPEKYWKVIGLCCANTSCE